MARSIVNKTMCVMAALALAIAMIGVSFVPQAQASSSYMINYHLNGGINPLSQYRSVMSGKTIKVSQLKKPTRTGYNFKGWYKDAKLKKAAKTVVGASKPVGRTLYARWAAISYKIAYKLNGGTQAKGQKTSYTITTKTFSLKTPTRNGYAFKGWCTSSGMSNDSIITKVKKGSTGKLTLYAKWAKAWNGDVNVDGVSVKSCVNDYSWEELSTLSTAISQTQSMSDALKVAANYHLCSSSGTLTGTETKNVTLFAGTDEELQTSVQITGFCHDPIDEDDVAGISFIFCDAVGMYMPDLYKGIWGTSDLRTVLQTKIFPGLPADLSQRIVDVQKLTNTDNTYPVTDPALVLPSTEKLWLYSVKELEGEITSGRGWSGDPDGFMIFPSSEIAVYNAEGTQYQLFKDMGLSSTNATNAKLARTYKGEKVSWYLRSADPEFAYFAFVNGEQNNYTMDTVMGGFSNYAQKGLVPGFCL